MSRNLPPAAGEEEDDFPEPPRLRALRRAVMGLMAVLALGVIVIAGTIAWRLGGMRTSAPEIPAAEAFELPAGAQIVALGGDGPYVLVAVRGEGGERLLTFRKSDGALLAEAEIRRR
jgi:hypothetical protein